MIKITTYPNLVSPYIKWGILFKTSAWYPNTQREYKGFSIFAPFGVLSVVFRCRIKKVKHKIQSNSGRIVWSENNNLNQN